MALADKNVLRRDAGLDLLPAARLLTDEREILAARRLHAAEHVRMGYNPESTLSPDGTLLDSADPWVPYSRYFGAFDGAGRLRATCRVIGNHAPCSLPTLVLPTIDAALRQRLEELPAGRLGEIASLARDPAVGREYPRGLFHAVWADAMDRGETTWVMNVDVPVLRTLRTMDQDAFRIAGRAAPAPVRPVFPVWVRVADLDAAAFVHGLDVTVVVLP